MLNTNLPNFDKESKNLIDQKCAYILEDLERIQNLITEMPYETLISDDLHSAAAERWLERTINRVLDINLHILRQLQVKIPSTYAESFVQLATLKIIDAKLAEQLKPCVGTRNILVHEYDDLQSVKFYQSLQKAVELFPQYIRIIKKYIDSNT